MIMFRSKVSIVAVIFSVIVMAACRIQKDDADVLVSGGETNTEHLPPAAIIQKSSAIVVFKAGDFCSAAFISKNRLLLADHCLDNIGEIKTILTGSSEKNYSLKLTPNGFLQKNRKADLAVLGVKEEPAVKPEMIANISNKIESLTSEFIISGYGHNITIGGRYYGKGIWRWGWITHEKDLLSYSPVGGGKTYTDIMLFSPGKSLPRASSCPGDSGGPIFAKNHGQWEITAVVSGSDPDCNYSTYAANAVKYRSWILDPN